MTKELKEDNTKEKERMRNELDKLPVEKSIFKILQFVGVLRQFNVHKEELKLKTTRYAYCFKCNKEGLKRENYLIKDIGILKKVKPDKYIVLHPECAGVKLKTNLTPLTQFLKKRR